MSDDGTQRGHSRSRWFKRVKPDPVPGYLERLERLEDTVLVALIESMWFFFGQGTRETEAMVWFFCRRLWKREVWWSCKLYSENDLLRESLWRNCEEAMRKGKQSLPWTILFVRLFISLAQLKYLLSFMFYFLLIFNWRGCNKEHGRIRY